MKRSLGCIARMSAVADNKTLEDNKSVPVRGEIENKSDPGASRLGNFINYYQFNSVDSRISLLPSDVCKFFGSQDQYFVLDIGCNSGDLTSALQSYLSTTKKRTVICLGLDIDPTLISRAHSDHCHTNIDFHTADFMLEDQRNAVIENFWKTHRRQNDHTFDLVTLLSVTMWVHLNNGDSGLEQLLLQSARLCHRLLVEPQPWKCYRSAQRRLVRSTGVGFNHYPKLCHRSSQLEEVIKNVLVTKAGMKLVADLGDTKWGRKIWLFAHEEVQ